MSTIVTFEEFGKTYFAIYTELPKVIMKTVDNIADSSIKAIQDNAPVRTGNMKRKVVKRKIGLDTVAMRAEADYSIYVDKGHRTRGTTRVPPNPFFSSVIDELKNGKLKQVLADNIKRVIERKPPVYSMIRFSKTSGRRYRKPFIKQIRSTARVRRRTTAHGRARR